MSTDNDKYAALLKDLGELSSYLHGRGDKTHALSLQFAENAKKDSGNRDFDLNQSRMLDYQRHIWNEIAVLVDKLVKQYS